jgi:hypothetical protein
LLTDNQYQKENVVICDFSWSPQAIKERELYSEWKDNHPKLPIAVQVEFPEATQENPVCNPDGNRLRASRCSLIYPDPYFLRSAKK